jgi:uroporphyrinogen decarboxylase
MAQTIPYEIIKANVEHTGPSRCGLTFTGERINDVYGVGLRPYGYEQKRWIEGEMEYYDDEWGNLWVRMVGRSAKGEIRKAAIEEWSQLDDFVPPNYEHPSVAQRAKEAFNLETDKYKLAHIGGWIFDNARYLRKLEIYLADMALYPDELKRMHSIVEKVYEQKIHIAGEAGAHGIFIGEDMGTQTGLLFSPAMFREYFKTMYTRLFSIAHDYDMPVFMHSCGYNWEIIPDLIDAGVNVFQFDQPAVYDMNALAALFKERKATLWSPIDIQKILPTGDREVIRAGAEEMYRLFGGFLICKDYPDLPGIGVDPDWDQWGYLELCKLAGMEA